MSSIKISVSRYPSDGDTLRFRAPCDCASITSLTILYPVLSGGVVSNATKAFTLKDSHGNSIDGISDLFKKDALLNVMLDVTNSAALIMNADTNGYIEGELDKAITSVVAGYGVAVSVKDGVATVSANYDYSQTDLTAGTSQLEEGKLYFVYE